MQHTSSATALSIENRFRQMENIADAIQYYMYYLNSIDSESLTDFFDKYDTVKNEISSLSSTFNFFNISIFTDNNIMSREGLLFRSLDDLNNDTSLSINANSGANSQWIHNINQKYPFMFSKTLNPIDSILCLRSFSTPETNKSKYVYFISIRTAEISNILKNNYSSGDIFAAVISENGSIITSTGNSTMLDFIGDSSIPDDLNSELFIAGKNKFTYKNSTILNQSLDNKWHLITIVPNQYLNSNSLAAMSVALILMFIIIIIVAALIVIAAGNLSKKVSILSDSMKNIQFTNSYLPTLKLDNSFSNDPNKYDEIDRLAVTYNEMIEMINHNLQEIMDLSIQQEKLNYQLLQSQINPHFLYNNLESIHACLNVEKYNIADQMLINLTKFYRMALKRSGDLISIRDELELSRLYLELQATSKEREISWDIQTAPDIENFLICKLTLQPFLENAILHGLDGINHPLKIHISVDYGDDTIIIIITDNGCGIPSDKLKEIQEHLADHFVDTTKHFGICNVNARISSPSYGNGTIKIDSAIYRGTIITITFKQLL
jgi:two-component system sensor histidine kinase YesM